MVVPAPGGGFYGSDDADSCAHDDTFSFHRGVQIPLPSGPHFYSNESWVGSIAQGNTAREAFDRLSEHATPFQGGVPSVNGGVIDIPHMGSVRQLVDPDRLTIVNTTEPGHLLYPGNVFRSIVQRGDDLYVVTNGYGTGVFPKGNEKAGRHAAWREPDHAIRRKLNAYAALGYPMDEMNAAAGIGNPATGPAQPEPPQSADRLRGVWSNDPMDQWFVQPSVPLPF
jgi:hypothetical protein